MDDFFKNSRFAIIFTGDEPVCYVVRGWDATVRKISEEIGGDPNGEPWEGFSEGLSDPEEWTTNDFGPWSYQVEFGDGGHLWIYRVRDAKVPS